MKVVKISELLGYRDSKEWLNQEVCGVVVQLSNLFTLFEKKFVKCVLAAERDHITVVVRSEKMVEKLDRERCRICRMKITLCNFQKTEGQLKTGVQSTIEIDYEDLPKVEVETNEAMLYAGLMDIMVIPTQPGNVLVSVTGRVRKIDRKVHETVPRGIVEVEDITTGAFVRVTLWREKTSLLEKLSERQDVTLYDLLTIDQSKDKYKGYALCTLNNSASTAIIPGSSPIDRENVQLQDIATYPDSNRFYDQTVSGRIIRIGQIFKVSDVKYIKCVIGDGEVGMLVLMKGHSIITKLKKESLEIPLKLSITTFQVKESIIYAESHSCVEIDDEDIPEVTNVNLSKLLYAPEVDYKDLQSHGQGTRISVQGRVKKIWTDEGRTTILIENLSQASMHVTFWREQQDSCRDIEIDERYLFYDLKIGNQAFKGASVGCAHSTVTTVVELITASDDIQTSPAKLTGTTETQVVARIGQKRVLFYCDEELRNNVQEIIPKKVLIKYTADKLLSYDETD